MQNTTNRRVAIYLPTLNMGGSEKVNLYLAEGLSSFYDVYIIVGTSTGDLDQLIPPNVKRIALNVKRSRYAILQLRKVMRAYNLEVLITSLFQTNFVSACVRWLLPRKFVLFIREDSTPSQYIRRWSWRYFIYLFHTYSADRLLAVGQEVRRDVIEFTGIDPRKIEYMPSPILRSQGVSEELVPVLPSFDGITLMSVCRIVPSKGLDTLIKMLPLVNKKIRARLVLVGPQTDRLYLKKLKKLVADLGVEHLVVFYGPTLHPVGLIALCDVFVFASRCEGLPGVLVEAMSLGKKIVSTRCKSGPSELLEDGRLGKLVEVDDYKAMAEQVLAYVDEPAPVEDLQLAARPFIQDAAAINYVKLIDQTCLNFFPTR